MKKFLSVFLGIFILFVTGSMAQVGTPGSFEKYSFQPEAAQMPEYSDGDFDHHGDFNYSVPITSISAPSGISFSLAIGYNSNIRYADAAGWLGLGWRFNPATITRSVQGAIFSKFDINSSANNLSQLKLINGANPVDFPSNIDNGFWDGFKDVYSLSLPDGRSVKFIYENKIPNSECHTFQVLDETPIKVYGYYHTSFGDTASGRLEQAKEFTIPSEMNAVGETVLATDYYAFVVLDETGKRYVFKEPTLQIHSGKNGARSLFYSTWRIVAILSPFYLVSDPQNQIFSEVNDPNVISFSYTNPGPTTHYYLPEHAHKVSNGIQINGEIILNKASISHLKYLKKIHTVNQKIEFSFQPDSDLDATAYVVDKQGTEPGKLRSNYTYELVTGRQRIIELVKSIKTGQSFSQDLLCQFSYDKVYNRSFLTNLDFYRDGQQMVPFYKFEYNKVVGNEYLNRFDFKIMDYHLSQEYQYDYREAYFDINGYFKSDLKYHRRAAPDVGLLNVIISPNGERTEIKYSNFEVFCPPVISIAGIFNNGIWGEQNFRYGIFSLNTKQYFNIEQNPDYDQSLITLYGQFYIDKYKYINYFTKATVSEIITSVPGSNKQYFKTFTPTGDVTLPGLPRYLNFDNNTAFTFIESINNSTPEPVTVGKSAFSTILDDNLSFSNYTIAQSGQKTREITHVFNGQKLYLLVGPYGTNQRIGQLWATNLHELEYITDEKQSSDNMAYFDKVYRNYYEGALYKISTFAPTTSSSGFTIPTGWDLGSYYQHQVRVRKQTQEGIGEWPNFELKNSVFYLYKYGKVQIGTAQITGYNSEIDSTEITFEYNVPAVTFYPVYDYSRVAQTIKGKYWLKGKVTADYDFPWNAITSLLPYTYENWATLSQPSIPQNIKILSNSVTTYQTDPVLNKSMPKRSIDGLSASQLVFNDWNNQQSTLPSGWFLGSTVTAYNSFGMPVTVQTPLVTEETFFGNSLNQMEQNIGTDLWYKPTGKRITANGTTTVFSFTAKYDLKHQLSFASDSYNSYTFSYDPAGRLSDTYRNGALISKTKIYLRNSGPIGMPTEDEDLNYIKKYFYNSASPDDYTGTALYSDGISEVQTVTGGKGDYIISEPIYNQFWQKAGSFVPARKTIFPESADTKNLPFHSDFTYGGNMQAIPSVKNATTAINFSPDIYTNSDLNHNRFQGAAASGTLSWQADVDYFSTQSLGAGDENEVGSFPFTFTNSFIEGGISWSYKPGADFRKYGRFSSSQVILDGLNKRTFFVDEDKKSVQYSVKDPSGKILESGILDTTVLAENLVPCFKTYDQLSGAVTPADPGLPGEYSGAALDLEPVPSQAPAPVDPDIYPQLNAGYVYYMVDPGCGLQVQNLNIPAGKHVELVQHETKQVIKSWIGPVSIPAVNLFVIPGLYEIEVYSALNTGNVNNLAGITGKQFKLANLNLIQRTQYKYDAYGRLKEVIHPDGNKTKYRYDFLGRMVKKETPYHEGKVKNPALSESDVEANPDFEYLYDSFGRLRFSIDPNQSVSNQMTYLKYDAFGRITETGTMNNSQFLAANANLVSFPTLSGNNTNINTVQAAASTDYPSTTVSFNVNTYNICVNQKFYYDLPAATLHTNYQTGYTKGKLGYKIEYIPTGTGNYYAKRTYYDYTQEGWLKSVSAVLNGRTTKEDYSLFNLKGMPGKYSSYYNGTLLNHFYYTYDRQDKVKEVKVSDSVNPTPRVLASYTEFHNGEGTTQQMILNQAQITISRQMDTRGWLKNISDSRGYFSSQLFYYHSVTDNGVASVLKSQFNGNIAAKKDLLPDGEEQSNLITTYTYDQINRLTQSKTYNPAGSPLNWYNTSYSYDIMGNILTQAKNIKNPDDFGFTQLDDIVYQYSGTRLSNTVDKIATARTDDYETTVHSISGSTQYTNQTLEPFTDNFSNYPVQTGQRPVSDKWDQVGFYGSQDAVSGIGIVNESNNLVLKLKPLASTTSMLVSSSYRSSTQKVVGSRSYQLSGKYKGVGFVQDEIPYNPRAYAGIEWLRADLTRISVQYVLTDGNSAAWVTFTGNLTAPVDAAYCRVLLINYNAKNTEVYYDDIVFEENGTNFKYDASGNVIKDLNRNILSITYDRQNLPLVITPVTGTAVKYGYSFSGERLWKQIGADTWWYVKSESGVILGEYKNSQVTAFDYVNYLGAGNEVVGYRKLESSLWKSYFYLKDHLGNNRVTFKDNNGTPLVVRSEDYYPFGATSRAWSTQTLAEMKFKYQGKERDTETGYDYFEARTYDPQLGRFLQVDPHFEKFVNLNPFVSMGDSPLNLLDPDGRSIVKPKNQKVLWAIRAAYRSSSTYRSLHNLILNNTNQVWFFKSTDNLKANARAVTKSSYGEFQNGSDKVKTVQTMTTISTADKDKLYPASSQAIGTLTNEATHANEQAKLNSDKEFSAFYKDSEQLVKTSDGVCTKEAKENEEKAKSESHDDDDDDKKYQEMSDEELDKLIFTQPEKQSEEEKPEDKKENEQL